MILQIVSGDPVQGKMGWLDVNVTVAGGCVDVI